MMISAKILVGLVALLHIYFLILEMFLWDKPFGLKTFGHNRDFAKASKTLAMNQGLYNGFLAAGLIWGLLAGHAGHSISEFFLTCIIIAGVFGAITVSRKILYFQALPAAFALVFVVLSRV